MICSSKHALFNNQIIDQQSAFKSSLLTSDENIKQAVVCRQCDLHPNNKGPILSNPFLFYDETIIFCPSSCPVHTHGTGAPGHQVKFKPELLHVSSDGIR